MRPAGEHVALPPGYLAIVDTDSPTLKFVRFAMTAAGVSPHLARCLYAAPTLCRHEHMDTTAVQATQHAGDAGLPV